MAWSAAAGSMKILQDDRDDTLLGLVSPGHSSITQELNRGVSKKRSHHYVVKEEIDEDDLSDELSNQAEKKRRLTVEQVKFLEMSFNKDLKLEPERKALLAKHLGIRPRQVAIWFQNRRARWKNKQLEQDFETLKTKYDSVLKEKESILREHEAAVEEKIRLQAKVVHLMSLLESPANNGAHDLMGVGSEGKSELMSPTKSVEDQSDMQDSGQSYAVSEGVVGEEMIGPSSYLELDPAVACTVNVKMENELVPTSPADDVFGNIPLLVHHLAANAIYLEDAFFYNCEDHFTGLAYYG